MWFLVSIPSQVNQSDYSKVISLIFLTKQPKRRSATFSILKMECSTGLPFVSFDDIIVIKTYIFKNVFYQHLSERFNSNTITLTLYMVMVMPSFMG